MYAVVTRTQGTDWAGSPGRSLLVSFDQNRAASIRFGGRDMIRMASTRCSLWLRERRIAAAVARGERHPPTEPAPSSVCPASVFEAQIFAHRLIPSAPRRRPLFRGPEFRACQTASARPLRQIPGDADLQTLVEAHVIVPAMPNSASSGMSAPRPEYRARRHLRFTEE